MFLKSNDDNDNIRCLAKNGAKLLDIDNNNNGYFYVLLLQSAHSPFINKNCVNIKSRKVTDLMHCA